MKKSMILAGAALLALAACSKSEVVTTEGPANQIAFKAISNPATKAGELDGITIDDKDYVIYASASQYSANGVLENGVFFNDYAFKDIAAPKWQHVTNESATETDPIYWPVGGAKMDFLAYALPINKKTEIPAPAFNSTVAASDVTVTSWDTYANQVDLLYAAANAQTSAANGIATDYVKMTFKHAQALLIFNVKVNAEVDGKLTVNEISFVEDPKAGSPVGTLVTSGTFKVDNSRNELKAAWTLSAAGTDYEMPDNSISVKSECNLTTVSGVENYGTALTKTSYAQLGETLLIPEQPRQNFTINYTVGGKIMDYTYNIERGAWEMGKKYIYNLDINVNEIIITEVVTDFVSVEKPVTIE